jgi:hypothetical protein
MPRSRPCLLSQAPQEGLLAQLTGLERRTARGGRDTIDHGPGGRDDLANAVAGALVFARSQVGAALPLAFIGRT